MVDESCIPPTRGTGSQHDIKSIGDLLMPKEKRMQLLDEWVERTCAIGKDGAWYADLAAALVGEETCGA